MRKESKFKQTENKRFSEPSSKMKKTEIGMIPEDWEVKELGVLGLRLSKEWKNQ